MKARISIRQTHLLVLPAIIVLVSLISFIVLAQTVPSLKFEAESGNAIAGAAVTADSTASGGSYLLFNGSSITHTWTNVAPGQVAIETDATTYPYLLPHPSTPPNDTGICFYRNNVLNRCDSTSNPYQMFSRPGFTLQTGDVLRGEWTTTTGQAIVSIHTVGSGTTTPPDDPPDNPPDNPGDYWLTVPTEHGPDRINLAGFPTPDNTGPRVPVSSMTDIGGSLTTTHDGQIIEKVIITGKLKILHDNVIVRDCIVRGTTTFAVDLRTVNGDPVMNSRVEYCEIDGTLMAEEDIPIHGGGGGTWTIHRNRIVNVGRASRGDSATSTFSENFIHTSKTGPSGSHRGGIGNNGGRNMTAIGNTVIISSSSGASGALVLYGDIAPGAIGHKVIGNLLAANAGFITYGGSVTSDLYPDGSDIEFRNNRYSTVFHPQGGRAGFMSSWEGGVRGNVASGNVIHETGALLPFNTQ